MKKYYLLSLIIVLNAWSLWASSQELLVKFRELPATQISIASAGQIPGLVALNQQYGLQNIDPLYPSLSSNSLRTNSLAENANKFPLRARRAPEGVVAPELRNTYKLSFPPSANMLEVAMAYGALANVEYAEPNKTYKLQAIAPNDPSYGLQWALPKMEADFAWEVATGSATVVVAVIDTGIEYTHADLQNRLWQNSAELSGRSGVDDDGNSITDDTFGADFVDISDVRSSAPVAGEDGYGRDNDPQDLVGHGSHVAGIIGSQTNNNLGVAALDWNCRVMPVRAGYLAGSGAGFFEGDDIAAAIEYAVNQGADIINMSFGGDGFDSTIFDALQNAIANGVVLVAAVGNESRIGINFPANVNNVIAVGAVSNADAKSAYSNSGTELWLVAPGDSIYSTVTGNRYDYMSGTSMAAPQVAGLSALLLGVSPNLTVTKVRNILAETADDLGPAGWDDDYGFGRINARRAINKVQSTPSLNISVVKVVQVTANGGLVEIKGTVTDPSLVSFSVSYSTDQLNPTNWLTTGITLTRNGLVTVNNSLLANWDITAIPAETVWLMLQAKQVGGKLSSKTITVNLINIGVGDIISPNIEVIKFDGLQIVTGDYVDVLAVLNLKISDNIKLDYGILEVVELNSGVVTYSRTVTGLQVKTSTLNWRVPFSPGQYYVRLTVVDLVGNSSFRLSPTFEVLGTNVLARVLAAPNPYYPNQGGLLYIGSTLSRAGTLRCVIHALNGEDVFRSSVEVPAGYYEFSWDGKDLFGHPVANGVYLAYVRSKDILGEVLVKTLKIAVVR